MTPKELEFQKRECQGSRNLGERLEVFCTREYYTSRVEYVVKESFREELVRQGSSGGTRGRCKVVKWEESRKYIYLNILVIYLNDI